MKRNKNQGFTLIELLIVTAIGGLLIALLAPAATKATGAAAKGQCVNNVRQITLSQFIYADEHAEKIPPIPEDPAEPWIANYIDDIDVFICSRDTRDGLGLSKPSYTTWAGTPSTLKPADAEGIASQNVIFFESDKTGINPETGNPYDPSTIGRNDATFERHYPQIVFSCLDGSVHSLNEDDFARIVETIIIEEPAGP